MSYLCPDGSYCRSSGGCAGGCLRFTRTFLSGEGTGNLPTIGDSAIKKAETLALLAAKHAAESIRLGQTVIDLSTDKGQWAVAYREKLRDIKALLRPIR